MTSACIKEAYPGTHRREGDRKAEAEIGVMWPQTKEAKEC